MKRTMMTMVMAAIAWTGLNAMSYERARQEAIYLTDKMAYELNLNDQQYNDAYEINLDYLMSLETEGDLYGAYLEYRLTDLRHILFDWQYNLMLAADYFVRPVIWRYSGWYFPIYSHYRRGLFYFDWPGVYWSYRGGHGHLHFHSGYYVSRRPAWRGGMRGMGADHRAWNNPSPHRGGGSMRRPQGLDRGRGNGRAEMGGNHNPNGRSGNAPDMRNGEKPGMRDGNAPGTRGSNPSMRGGNEPSTRSESSRSMRSGSTPSMRSGSAPSVRNGSAPSVRNGSTPSVRSGSAPTMRSGSAPSTRSESHPSMSSSSSRSMRSVSTPSSRGNVFSGSSTRSTVGSSRGISSHSSAGHSMGSPSRGGSMGSPSRGGGSMGGHSGGARGGRGR